MDDLVVNSQLIPTIVDDKNTNAASAIGKRLIQPRPQTTLIEDRQTLLDITSLGHGDNTAIVTNVEDTVLLEDWAEHILDNDGRRWVRHEAGLLMELLAEEVHSEVAVLASLSRRGDTDDLARTTLQDYEITDANVVTWDSDGVGGTTAWRTGDNTLLLLIDLLTLDTGVKRVEDTVGGLGDTLAEGVVMTVLVVVTHLGFRGLCGGLTGWVGGSVYFGSDFLTGLVPAWDLFGVNGLGPSTIVAFGKVEV